MRVFTCFAASVLSVQLFAASDSLTDHCIARYPWGQVSGQGETHYGPARPVDVLHTRLDIAVDFDNESIHGKATHTVVPVGEPVEELVLDAVDLVVTEVLSGAGETLDYETGIEKLQVHLPAPVAPGEEFTFSVSYHVERPARGMHFRTRRMGYKDEEVQCWTQGEPEDARYWFPCFDYPLERATTEVRVTAPEGFRALSNGTLQSESKTEGGKTVYHWRQEEPHPSYLVSLLVGRFAEIKDEGGRVPLYYYVPPGREAEGALAFGNTSKMMTYFEKVIGVPYPFSRYSQVTVVDFIAGGMENTSITTLTDRTLHDAAAHLTYSSDWLVAHELAHQWFGDLLTCRDWSHLWLNEGFATFFELLWLEESAGKDWRDHELIMNGEGIVSRDSGGNRAPVVRAKYGQPSELFDVRVYDKGGWILHMLRKKLGDERFFKALHEYCERHQNQAVETTDLLRTFEEVSGEGLEQFFQQWVYSGGYPEIKVDYAWDNAKGIAKVTVRQTQTVDAITPLFRLDTELLFQVGDAQVIEAISISETEHIFHVKLDTRPDFVRIDPDQEILMKLDFKKPLDMLTAQLERDSSVAGRYEAADALASEKSDESVEALAQALNAETFWGVRARAAAALGKVDNPEACGKLVEGTAIGEARVRLAVAKALGDCDTPESIAALQALAAADPSPYVVAEAVRALGNLRAKNVSSTLTRALDTASHNEAVRTAALQALAEIGGAKELPRIMAHLHPDKPRMVYGPAANATAEIGQYLKDRSKPRAALLSLLDSPNPWLRQRGLDALVTLGDLEAIPGIEAFAASAKDPQEKEAASKAVAGLNAQRRQTEEVEKLRLKSEDLDKKTQELEKNLKSLQDLVETLGAAEKDAPANAEANNP